MVSCILIPGCSCGGEIVDGIFHHGDNCKGASEMVERFSCGHTQQEHNGMHNLHFTERCINAEKAAKEQLSKEQIDKRIEELTRELKELEKARNFRSLCEHSQAFLNFMKTSPIRIKLWGRASGEVVCGHCGHDIPEAFVNPFVTEG